MLKKLVSLTLLGLLVAACAPETPATEPPATEDPPIQTEAPAMEEPVETEEPVPTEPPATEEPASTEPPATEEPETVCAKLLTPENDVYVPAVGKVTFSWEPVEGAEKYILRFTLPNDTIVEFETDETTKDRYMEAFGISGEFEWNVAALDVTGNEICVSETALFTRPAQAKNSNGGDGGSETCTGFGCGTGGAD